MLLCVDVGNSRTNLALYRAGERVFAAQYVTRRDVSAAELGAAIQSALADAQLASDELSGVAVSSVVPALDGPLREALQEQFGCPPAFIGRELRPHFPVRYDPPSAAGADRLANVAGALAWCEGPLIVVDCGSAINLEVVSADGAFIGGAILAGPEAMREALYGAAPHLPRVEVEAPARVIGRSSQECLQSGLYYGLVSLLEGLIRRTQDELGVKARVIGTGGWSAALLKDQPWVDLVEPLLTLDGVYRIWEANRRQ